MHVGRVACVHVYLVVHVHVHVQVHVCGSNVCSQWLICVLLEAHVYVDEGDAQFAAILISVICSSSSRRMTYVCIEMYVVRGPYVYFTCMFAYM